MFIYSTKPHLNFQFHPDSKFPSCGPFVQVLLLSEDRPNTKIVDHKYKKQSMFQLWII